MVLMLAVLSSIPSASAQSGSQVGPAEEMELKIHELQHTRAAEAATMLQKLFPEEVAGGVKVTADERSNSLAIRAPASVQRFIATFLKNADRPDSKRPPAASSANEGPDASEPASNPSSTPSQIKSSADEKAVAEIKIFKLTNTRASDAAELLQGLFRDDALQTLFPDESSVPARFSVDARTNSVIVIASEPHQKLFEALLLNLDEQVDSKQPKATLSTGAVGGGGSDSLTGMAAKLRRNNNSEAIGSLEFQRYEQEAHAAAEAYRQQLVITPKDEARLAQIKADLQGAVHSAFHARQAWQRNRVAEMRKRLDEIEKNISARSQRDKEIIERRVDDLINPEQQWESETTSGDQDASTTGETSKDRLYNSDDLNAFPPMPASSPRQPVWLTDEAIAAAKSASLNRPIAYYLFQSGKPDAEVLHSVEMRKALVGFVAVKLSADSNAAVRVLNSHLAADTQREFPMLLVVTKDFGTFGPYHDFSKNGGKDILDNLYQIKQLALGKRQDPQGDKPEIAGKGGGDSSGVTKPNEDNNVPGRDVWMNDYQAAKEKARDMKRPLLICFYLASWPNDVISLDTELLKHPDVLRLLGQSFVAVKVDTSAKQNAKVGIGLKPKGIPSYVVTNQHGAVFSQEAGLIRKDGGVQFSRFVSMLDRGLAKFDDELVPSKPASMSSTTGPPIPESGPDPRRSLLEAENAVILAKAAVAEAAVEAEAADGYLPRLLEAQKTGGVGNKVVIDAQNESKRKAAALNRVRADLLGKERVLALAKEHLEAQIKIAELELKQAKAHLDRIGEEEIRANTLNRNKAISMEEFEKAVAATQQARYAAEMAKARYELYRKALPGQREPASNSTKEGQTDPEKPANATKPGEKRE
jgi:hypothetical protein